MSSEHLASAQNQLKGNLGGAWNILDGAQGQYQDLGIARRFGGSAAAYSLRDIGAMNGRVVRVRRDSDDAEEDFSANQVASGALETFVQDGAAYNEFSGDPVKAGGGSAAITLTNVSNTGFTAEISGASGTKQINFPLTDSLVSGDDYFVSFDYTSTSTSTVGVKPRTAALGSASNDVISATNSGFYGGTGDASHNGFDVNNTATVLSFQTTANSFTFTVSNLKASRIARNGFVETWYDQSSSGNNATQTTAGQQPKVVENGGIIKNVKGFPSLKFEFAPRTELDIGLLISNLNSVSGYVVTQKDDGDTNVLAGFTQGVSSDNSRFYLPFYGSNGSLPNFGYNNSATKISFGTALTGTCNLYSVFTGDTNIEAFKNGSSVGTTALVDQDVTATDSKIGQLSNSFYLDGKISEIFLTTQKLQSDAATINSDVTSYYNL